MKKSYQGFTLIELMISITILLLFAGIGLISLNNFNAKQKIAGTKNELVSSLKLSRNYALTMQLPEGVDSQNVLNYVDVNLSSNGQMTTIAKDVGDSYFSKDVSPGGIKITIDPPSTNIQFSAYKGSSIDGDISIIISSTEGVGDTQVVNINSSGLIDEK